MLGNKKGEVDIDMLIIGIVMIGVFVLIPMTVILKTDFSEESEGEPISKTVTIGSDSNQVSISINKGVISGVGDAALAHSLLPNEASEETGVGRETFSAPSTPIEDLNPYFKSGAIVRTKVGQRRGQVVKLRSRNNEVIYSVKFEVDHSDPNAPKDKLFIVQDFKEFEIETHY